ncbi:hypothetical protein [Streptomyces niveiscabiei]|uniref:Uncharacterized protein n=1 Tax=Streptomyces niveiscabiei TaxID=164115 RepID=A0ABW9I6Z9_9ACTN
MDRYFWNLTPRQADGLSCVLCGADYLMARIPSVVVGKVPDTEAPVYACARPCAERIAEEAESMAREMRDAAAEAGAGADWPNAADDVDDDGALGSDGHFGKLLRDLRALVGTEALLAVSDDLATIRFLLGLTAHHADEANRRATALLGRLDGGEG